MPLELQHQLNIKKTLDESSKLDFVASLRAYVLNDMANKMRDRYEQKVEPAFERKHSRKPESGTEVHKSLMDEQYFQFYSSMRCTAQRMVWNSVIDPIERNYDALSKTASELINADNLNENQSLDIPKNVSALDVHLSPGGYSKEYNDQDITTGAIYDNGLAVFSFGMMGLNLDDIGMSMANYIRHTFPDFKPEKIVDFGCTVGHNTSALAKTWSDAEVTGIDVAAPPLRYATARSKSQNLNVKYSQQDAEKTDFPDNSVNMVFSSMFLHELSAKVRKNVLKEAYRILKPGGLMLHMELPPTDQLGAYDNFYLDWDSYYNNEPYYKGFRAENCQDNCVEAGFAAEDYLQFTTPQYTYISDEEYQQKINQDEQDMDDKVGRLSNELSWYGFGAWKNNG